MTVRTREEVFSLIQAHLGDSVLALAVTAHLYPRLEAERFGAGRLTKIRAQAVSGVSCGAVAERLLLPQRLRAAAPHAAQDSAAALVVTERVLASVIEAVIGACYLHAGYERTAAAVVEAFGPEIEDRKSTRLNSSHSQISYAVFCLKKKKKHNDTLGAETYSLASNTPFLHSSASPVSDIIALCPATTLASALPVAFHSPFCASCTPS